MNILKRGNYSGQPLRFGARRARVLCDDFSAAAQHPATLSLRTLFWQRRRTGVGLGRASLRLCSAADLSSYRIPNSKLEAEVSMYIIYNILLFLATILLSPVILFKLATVPKYRGGISQKFGRLRKGVLKVIRVHGRSGCTRCPWEK